MNCCILYVLLLLLLLCLCNVSNAARFRRRETEDAIILEDTELIGKTLFQEANTSSTETRKPEEFTSRIVGGQISEDGKWPWMAAIFKGRSLKCGGTLIDRNHVLTAAHCVYRFKSSDVQRMTIRLGEYDLDDDKHIVRRVKRFARHKGFNLRTLHDDIAILTLDRNVYLSPIQLYRGTRSYVDDRGIVIGWGKLKENGKKSDVLREVDIPIVSNDECDSIYGTMAPGGITSGHLCAGLRGQDACTGDSGGPLVVKKGDSEVQVGITSFGIGCGGRFPGVYTRVSEYVEWIDKNTDRY